MASVAGTLPGEGTVRRELRSSLNLTRELAITQFKLKYTGSALGYIWSLVKPGMTFLIMYVVFARLLRAGAASPNFTMQLLVGIVVWTFFVETVTMSVSVVAANASLMKKASFPRPILIIASNASAAMTFVINLSLIVIIAAPLGGIALGWRSLMLFPLILELYVFMLGLSLLLSALFVQYRDVGHLWDVSANVLVYASAVVYPLALLQDHHLAFLAVNPVAQVIEDIRHAIVTPLIPWTYQVSGWGGQALTLGIIAATFGIGAAAFRTLTPRFAEYL